MNGFDIYYPKRGTLTTTEPRELSHIETQISLIKAVHARTDTSTHECLCKNTNHHPTFLTKSRPLQWILKDLCWNEQIHEAVRGCAFYHHSARLRPLQKPPCRRTGMDIGLSLSARCPPGTDASARTFPCR